MNWKLRVSVACYLLASLLLVAFGLVYMLRSEFMPYHADAVGMSWAEVDPAFRVLFLGLMKVTGGGFLASAFALLVVLFTAFREGQRWSYWTVPVVGLIVSLSSLYVTLDVLFNTPASPPWMAAALGTLLVIVGFAFSMLPGTKARQEQE